MVRAHADDASVASAASSAGAAPARVPRVKDHALRVARRPRFDSTFGLPK